MARASWQQGKEGNIRDDEGGAHLYFFSLLLSLGLSTQKSLT